MATFAAVGARTISFEEDTSHTALVNHLEGPDCFGSLGLSSFSAAVQGEPRAHAWGWLASLGARSAQPHADAWGWLLPAGLPQPGSLCAFSPALTLGVGCLSSRRQSVPHT